MLSYQDPRCAATLGEAVAELRAAEADEMSGTVAPELARHMDPHDVVHVLFGCGTDLFGEVQAHLWMLIGTTARMRDMHRATTTADHRATLAKIGHGAVLRVWLRAIPAGLSIMVRALRMTRRWPIDAGREAWHRPLDELRREYGIAIR